MRLEDCHTNVRTNANLYAHFQQHFPRDPGEVLLVTAAGQRVSYAEAEQASSRIANCLLHVGAAAGDRVTVQVEKSPENLFLYLACLRAGLVYHPLNMAYQPDELAYFLKDAEPTVVVCDARAEATMASILPAAGVNALLTLNPDGSGSLMELATGQPADTAIACCEGSDMAALLYSSGTTGKPKGIVLTHDNLRSSAQTLAAAWGFTNRDRLMHALPIYHVHGLFIALGCVLMSGASMVWHNHFREEAVIASLPQCTVMMGVPTYYTRLLANPRFNSEHCSGMRLFISGSAPLLAETFTEFLARTGHTILERYGMTETSINTSNPLLGERRAGTVGLALPGVTLRVVDDHGRTLPNGEPGDLQVKGANVFPGYWRMPDKTAEDFTADGFFNTGDKATVDQNDYVTIVGRSKDMIISGGLNVYPKEIELLLDSLPGVAESAVVGVPDKDFGEAVVAVLVADGQTPDADEVARYCRMRLANFKVPKKIYFMDALPRNAMGKVQKNLLRERFGSRT